MNFWYEKEILHFPLWLFKYFVSSKYLNMPEFAHQVECLSLLAEYLKEWCLCWALGKPRDSIPFFKF